MIWAPQMLENPPYAPETTDGVGCTERLNPLELPDVTEGEIGAVGSLLREAPHVRVGTGW